MDASSDLFETTQCLCLASRRAARAITRRFDRELSPHGIRATQFTLLSALSLKGPSTIGDLAERLGADRTTLTRNLAVAGARGLVSIAAGEDARSRLAAITPEGRRILTEAFAAWRRVQASLTDALGDEAAQGLRRLSDGPSLARRSEAHPRHRLETRAG